MKLFLDDVRDVPDTSWTLARTVDDAIFELRQVDAWDWEVVSLDYDLGLTCPLPHVGGWQPIGCEHTDGTHLIRWFAQQGQWPQAIRIHSQNPDGARLLEAMLEAYGFSA